MPDFPFPLHRRTGGIAAMILLGLSCTATQAAGPQLADVAAPSGEAVPSIVVDYGDLNLASLRGQRALLRRLRNAAERVCDWRSARRLQEQRASDECVRQSLARAVKEVGDAEVTALYESGLRSVGSS